MLYEIGIIEIQKIVNQPLTRLMNAGSPCMDANSDLAMRIREPLRSGSMGTRPPEKQRQVANGYGQRAKIARVNPYWLEDPQVPRLSPRHEGTVDVAIIGAGVTGCAAALRLAEAGLRVRVHDARAVAEGASGRNGGFALRGGATRYDVARETYGVEQARGLWNWTERALDRIETLAGDALQRPGSFRLAADEEEREQIHAEYEAF